MKEKFMRFMQGRYGVDQLSKALLVIGLISILLASFFRGSLVGTFFYYVEALCGESGVSCKVIQDPLLFCKAERSVPAEKAVSYL